jgi:hypothetical protein
MTTPTLPLAALALACTAATNTQPMDTPRELGDIRWQRQLEPALAEAQRAQKPALVLFLVVPG